MERHILLTIIKKYSRFILICIVFVLIAGCGNHVTPIDSSATGFFDHYFVYPFSLLIKTVATWLQGQYGLSIILITLSIRLVLMPFLIKQSKESHLSQEKWQLMKPEMEIIQKKYEHKKSLEDQLSFQKEMSRLWQKHQYHPGKMIASIIPIIVQMPFLIAFYYAIRRTPEIADQMFLWFSLGDMDLLFVLLAIVIYYLQARVGLIDLEGQQRKQLSMMSSVSPVLIGIIALNVPSALTLYWVVGGLFMIVQSLYIKKFVLPKMSESMM